jgi:type IV pilus assembly protein PilY1
MRPTLNPTLPAKLLASGLLMAVASGAGGTDLADKPLANATTVAIMPNIMLDLDNSGSMAWDYMPDYVRMRSDWEFGRWCRDATGNENAAVCAQGDPPYFASAFNKLYYNPAVRYQWPVNADGTRRPDGNARSKYASPWDMVPSDGYGVQAIDQLYQEPATAWPCYSTGQAGGCPRIGANTTIDLVNGYPDRQWCDANEVECKPAISGGMYAYPSDLYPKLKIVKGAPYYYNVQVEWCNDALTSCQANKTAAFSRVRFSGWQRVDIKYGSTFVKGLARTDCAGTVCTYDEEMSNFATWYAWYRTRAQTAKSAIGHAFVDVRGTPKLDKALLADPSDSDFFHARIGLTTIDTTTINLPIAPFEGTQKTSFFEKLYKAVPSGGTPLRTALNEVGKMYQGTSLVYPKSPIEHACQRNFTILATDGYWNGDDPGLGDQDGKEGVKPPSYMPATEIDAQKTLADVAHYYYHTDLRTDLDNIVPGSGKADFDDVARHQHMTTFTLGLGVNGTLAYRPDYKTATSGDYHDIVQGTKHWPVPKANQQETIDDLWHAAVNGRGHYFSAQDPVALEEGMRKALNSIDRTDGSGAAAATSNLQPTAGDNLIYIAKYRTQLWDGELSAYTIDLDTGKISDAPLWQASPLLREKIDVKAGTDTRTIWTSNSKKQLVPFQIAEDGTGVSAAHFDNSALSQYSEWSTEQKAAAKPATMLSYLRGNDPAKTVTENGVEKTVSLRLYRERDKLLGDFVHSQPVYVKMPPHDFKDDGYLGFKSAQSERKGMVYAAANDGMLHAFDADTGAEMWAYIPPMVVPNLWQLADASYGDRHRYFLDGPLAVSDAKLDDWRTVLIGALGKGGRGYYALDITEPATPRVLWTFSTDNNANVGYSYGTPFITKLSNGQWVAVLTSGYNNVPEKGKFNGGDGRGHVFVVNLATGELIRDIKTTAGDAADPSGLARLNLVMEDFDSDNTAIAAYGGDLHGNMWRFSLTSSTPSLLMELGRDKPIMTAPEISKIDGARVVFFATGRFLGEPDLSTKTKQVIVGVKDANSQVAFPGSLVAQEFGAGGDGLRTGGTKTVKWDTAPGWYVELPDSGERVAVDPQLYFGTLLVSSVVPSATPCQPGGYSWLYQLNFRTGGVVNKNVPVGHWQSSPIVGLTVSKLPNGTPVIHSVKANGEKPKPEEMELSPAGKAAQIRRVLWRELAK